jgi:quercetin dioxygenase-like cupin family protein
MKIYFVVLLFLSVHSFAQVVPVREEPRHKPVIVNEYFRVLDVNIPPGDTTLFHIHETPSLFVRFTNTYVAVQVKDSAWSKKNRSTKGSADYDYFGYSRVHRVANQDRENYHVTDIELLSAYQPGNNVKPLPFTILFNNEKAFAYRITSMANGKQHIEHRGPIIAALVEGGKVVFKEEGSKESTVITGGKLAYLPPGKSYELSNGSGHIINLVLFELK